MEPRFTLAEDEPSYLFLVETILRKNFPESHIAAFSAAEDALQHILENGTDVLISDHGMGEMVGTELIRELRKRGYKIPIIMMSGDPSVATEALEAGADEFLEKSTALASLEDRIRAQLGK